MRELLGRAPARIGIFLAILLVTLLAAYGLGSLVGGALEVP
jgi:hypothetical protein